MASLLNKLMSFHHSLLQISFSMFKKRQSDQQVLTHALQNKISKRRMEERVALGAVEVTAEEMLTERRRTEEEEGYRRELVCGCNGKIVRMTSSEAKTCKVLKKKKHTGM